jgi:predicted nucleotidyltransferase
MGEALAAAVRRFPDLKLLVLHGSRARGTAHARSDWDFAYLGGEGLDQEGLTAALTDAAGTDDVDAVDLDHAGALLRQRVARDGLLIYEATRGTFDNFRLAAIHAWCDLEPVLSPLYERVLRDVQEKR